MKDVRVNRIEGVELIAVEVEHVSTTNTYISPNTKNRDKDKLTKLLENTVKTIKSFLQNVDEEI